MFTYTNIFDLLLKNVTTIESLKRSMIGGSYKNKYDMGKMKNFTQFFGEEWHQWWIPIIPNKGKKSNTNFLNFFVRFEGRRNLLGDK